MKPQNFKRARSASPTIRVPSEHVPLNLFHSPSAYKPNFFRRIINQTCYKITSLLEKRRYKYFLFVILILVGLNLLQGNLKNNQLVLGKVHIVLAFIFYNLLLKYF